MHADPIEITLTDLGDPQVLAAIVQGTEDVIFAKDTDGRYRYANEAAARAMGCGLEGVVGRTDAQIMPPEVARRLMDNDRRVFASGETLEVEEPVPQPDGTMRYWLTRKMPLRDSAGEIVGLLGIARDITTRKQVEAQNDAIRMKLQIGIQAAGLLMAEIDYRADLNHISAELARLLELGDGPMTVPRQVIFDRVHPEDRQRYLDAIAHTVDPAGGGYLAIDVRALVPSGAVKWIHIRLQVTFTVIDGQLRPDKGICAAREVTAERVAEMRLHEAIAEVTEADRRKDEFIATLAHELRNPLAPIRNGLEILKRTPDLPAGAVKVRDMMERQLLHMVRLVDDLLDVSRITRDKLEMRMQPIQLAEIVAHALEASRPAIDAARHVLQLDVPERPLWLYGDLTRLAQVVSNLLNNAAKYTEPGGHIELVAHEEDGELVLSVADSGAGIPPEMLNHVFDLFSQVDRTLKHAQGGLGIGLWLVKKLVQLHGGTIHAESEGLGRGSRFTVRLPLQAGAGQP